jgi:DNA segregation ATPase FtsK/SpoIIIE-like protein
MKREQIRTEFKKSFLMPALEIIYAADKEEYAGGSFENQSKAARMALRKILNEKLPCEYYVGSGYVIDSSLAESPHFDIIIAENTGQQVLFKADDDEDCYFPVESVFAVGDIIPRFSAQKKPVEAFASDIASFDRKLKRLTAPSTMAYRNRPEIQRAVIDQSTANIKLFSFLMFAHSGDFSLKSVQSVYNSTQPAKLPSCLVMLDKGIIEFSHVENNNVERISDFNYVEIPLRGKNRWVYSYYNSESEASENTFAAFYYNLTEYLKQTVLSPYDMREYFAAIMDRPALDIIEKQEKISTITDGRGQRILAERRIEPRIESRPEPVIVPPAEPVKETQTESVIEIQTEPKRASKRIPVKVTVQEPPQASKIEPAKETGAVTKKASSARPKAQAKEAPKNEPEKSAKVNPKKEPAARRKPVPAEEPKKEVKGKSKPAPKSESTPEPRKQSKKEPKREPRLETRNEPIKSSNAPARKSKKKV